MKNEVRTNNLLPDGVPRYVRVYDNQGETFDRFTVVFTGHYTHKTNRSFVYLGMSENPFHPLGFGQHGETGYQPCDRPKYSHLGKKISFTDLPVDCQKAAIQSYKDLWDLK